MVPESKLVIYDYKILALMYVLIFDIQHKFLYKKSHIQENEEAAILFFRQQRNYELLKDYYGALNCVTAKWDKSH